MSEEAKSSVPMIVVIVIAVLSILYALISICSGSLGVVGAANAVALLEGDLRLMSILSVSMQIINLLTCGVIILTAIVALVKRSFGRWLLAGSLILALVVDMFIFAGVIGLNVYFMGGSGVEFGLLFSVVLLCAKGLFCLVSAALLAFMGKES